MDSSVSLHLQILGPLRLWRGEVELDVGPRQQAYLLALLLARADRPVSTSALIDLIWEDDAPSSALNVIHRYVGALRRLLEPGLSARDPGSYLPRRGSAYAFVPTAGMLDLITFRDLVREAEIAHAEQRDGAALDNYVKALNLWQGPAGDGLSFGPAGVSIFTALDSEFLDACTAAGELAVRLGRPEDTLRPLQLAAAMAALNERVHAALVMTLAAAGQQAEALSTYRRVRARLADELGIDPGPALQTAHQLVLEQAVPPGNPTATKEASSEGRPETTAGGEGWVPDGHGGLVGRTNELAVLHTAIRAASAGGSGLVVVEGEPGMGKTRLLESAAAEAEQRGALVVWGNCLPGEGTPSMWPWVTALDQVLADLPSARREEWLAGELGSLVQSRGAVLQQSVRTDSGSQFRLFEQVVGAIAEESARRPVVIIVDDLQWADTGSLQLFEHVAARLPSRTAIFGALRDRAPAAGPELLQTMAAASRVRGHRRIRLGPLSPTEVAELVRDETGKIADPAVAHSIHSRTAGNPFFSLELSRLLTDSGELTEEAVARAGVPATVRDVVRDRMSGLDDDSRELLQVAALIGRDIDLGLLARVAGVEIERCLDRLGSVEALGFIGPKSGDPYSIRFAHDLIREPVAATTPPAQAARLHLRIADALDRDDPDGGSDAERLAHHVWAAGPLADPARTAAALIRAGRHATVKSAFDAAERQLRSAAHVARTGGLADLELSALSQLALVIEVRSMWSTHTIDVLERAETLARDLGREQEAMAFLFYRWTAHVLSIDIERTGPLARRLLEQGEASSDPFERTTGVYAWGIYQWQIGNIGESFRHLRRIDQFVFNHLPRREENALQHDLQLMMAGMSAMVTTLHGDIDAGRALLNRLEAATGDEPYAVTVWASLSAMTAALVDDPAWALRAARSGIAVDAESSFEYFGSYLRLARCWARARTGDDPAEAAAEAEEILTTHLLEPPLSSVGTWYGHLGDMWLRAGELDKAAEALDRADWLLDTYGQRYPEGLILLHRARLLHARGVPFDVVRAAAERARSLSLERAAYLFAHRADEWLAAVEAEREARQGPRAESAVSPSILAGAPRPGVGVEGPGDRAVGHG